jgi:hypothetical protein
MTGEHRGTGQPLQRAFGKQKILRTWVVSFRQN